MSIWLTKAFIGAVLCKNGCWMRTLLSEKDGDGGFSFIAWKRCDVICSEVHAVSADLAYGFAVLLAVCSAICSAEFGFFLPGRTLNG